MRTHGTTSNENAAPDSPRSPHLKSKDSSRSPNQTSKDSSRSLQHTPKDSPRSLHHTPKDSPHHTSKDSGYSPNDNNQNGIGSASIGFHDLTFTDFSSHKYPLIAQSFCESNIRKSSSPYHNFQCSNCPKAFPCAAALSLHQQKSHNSSIISTDHTSLKMETPESQSKPSTLSSTFCHICQIDLGSSVEYAAHQTKHRYDSFLSSVVKGVNLTSSTSSPSINFSKAIVTNPSITTDKLPSIDNADVVIKNFSNDDDNDEDHQQYLSNDNEKEQFLAMLQLHKKNINNSLVKVQSIDGSSPFRDLESNAKPPFNRLNKNSITNSSKTKSKIKSKVKSKVNSKTTSRKLDGPLTDKTKEPKKQAKHDLADSNYTNSKDSLLKNVTSCSSLLSFANSSSLDNKKTSFKKRRLSTPTSSVRSPSRASASLPLQDTDKMNGENSNPPSIEATTSSSPSEDGEKEMEIDLPENNSSGTSGSMGKENSEEMDTGETVQQNSSMNANVPQPNHRCEICALEFKTFNALKRHNRGHTKSGHNYVCNMCSYTSLDKSTLVRHLRTHNGERPFQCAICKYAFTTKSNCERHVRKRHKKLSKPEIKSSMLFNAGLTKSSPTSDSSQVTIQNITRHNSSPNISGPEWPGPNDTLCRSCNLDLKSNKVLRHHIKTLHNALSQKPYSCTLCKLGFSTKNNCIRHVIRLHPEMKKDIKSVVLVNGTSVNGNSQSGSDEISESEAATLGEASQNGGNSTIGTVARRKANAASTSSTIKHSQPLNSASNCSFTETSNPPPSIPAPNAPGHEDPVDAITLAWQFHSSLAALCQIISPISPIAGNSTATVASVPRLPGAVERKSLSTVTEDYDGDESNSEYQPLDLAKTSDSEKEPIPSKGTPRNQPMPTRLFYAHCEPQPLDLAAHALDLSVKTTPTKLENQCLVDLNKCSEPIRTAASSLLALQSFIPASK